MPLTFGTNAGGTDNRIASTSPLTIVDFTLADFTDVLFILIYMIDGTTLTTPSGWSALPVVTSGNARLGVVYKMSPTGNVNFTFSGTRLTAFCHFNVTGADLLEPIRQPSSLSGASQTVTTPQVTTTGGSGDVLLTYSSMFIPLTVDNTKNYSMDTKLIGASPVADYTGGIGGIGTDRYATPVTGQANANGGSHRPLFAGTTYTNPGSTVGGYSQALFGTPWPSGARWGSGAFIIKSAAPSSGRRFFMIV